MALQARDGRAQAEGDVHLGDYIFLIDCDTRIPVDAFLDAASEMETCPEVAILQHCSGVMYVADHFFENMMGFFTDIVNWVRIPLGIISSILPQRLTYLLV